MTVIACFKEIIVYSPKRCDGLGIYYKQATYSGFDKILQANFHSSPGVNSKLASENMCRNKVKIDLIYVIKITYLFGKTPHRKLSPHESKPTIDCKNKDVNIICEQ